MNDYVDWDKAYLEEDVLGMGKAEWREKLAADTEVFLANGGEIDVIPYNPIPELAARVGYWQPMGQEELDDMLDSDEGSSVY